MALVYSKDKEYHIGLKRGDVGKYVLLPGDPGRCELIARFLDNPKKVGQNREYVTYTGSLLGEKVSVVSTGIGGASAAIALEELVHIGADTFIRVGTAGGMQMNIEAGDLVIASGAIRLDGTSKEYAPLEFPAVAHIDIVSALMEASSNVDAKCHVGVVQCKDAFYGQHDPENMPIASELKNKWEAYIKCGALASEMESATLFVVGAIRRVKVGSVLLVVGNQTRRAAGLPELLCHNTETAIQTAIEAIKIIIQKETGVHGNV